MTHTRRITLAAAAATLALTGCASVPSSTSSRIHMSDDLFESHFLMAAMARYQQETQLAEGAIPPQDFRPLRIAAADTLGQSMHTQHIFYGYAYAGLTPRLYDDDATITLAK